MIGQKKIYGGSSLSPYRQKSPVSDGFAFPTEFQKKKPEGKRRRTRGRCRVS